jgi:pyrroline-5-carboxylate reductase
VIVGLIGAGNMGRALARGWAAAESGPDELMFGDVDAARAKEAADEVGGKAASNGEVADSADIVVLAMKPGSLTAVAEDVRVTVSDRQLPVVSILGATTIGQVTQAFGPGTPVVRFMPNVAAEVRQGTFCYARGENVDDRLERDVLDLFGLLGEIIPVEERLMEAATAISGCGPGFLALIVEAFVDAGVRQGLTAGQAAELVIQNMAGTAELLRRRGDAQAVRRAVTSPGGVTAAGIAALEERGLRAAVGAAVEAVVTKAHEAQAASGGSPR